MGAETAPDGTYGIGGLAAGTYRVEFMDPWGIYASEFFDGKPTLNRATNVTVTSGAATPNINATLDIATTPYAATASLALTIPKVTVAAGGQSITTRDGPCFVLDRRAAKTDGRTPSGPSAWAGPMRF